MSLRSHAARVAASPRLRAGLATCLAALFALGGVGCRGERNRHDRRDAASDAAIRRMPWVGMVAARVTGANVALTPMRDDGLVLRTGTYVYTIDRRGVIARIGAPSDYETFLEPGDTELGGPRLRELVAGTPEIAGSIDAPFVRLPYWKNTPEEDRGKVVRWNGSAWVAAAKRPPLEEDYRSASFRAARTKSTAGLPADHVWRHHHTTKSRIVWIGHRRKPGGEDDPNDPSREDVTAVAPAEGEPGELVELPRAGGEASADAGSVRSRTCQFLESADDGAYLSCVYVTDGKDETRFFQLEGRRWKPYPLAAIGRLTQVVDAEGALWYLEAVAGVGTTLMRVEKGGAPEPMELPAPPPDLGAPSYRTRGDRRYTSWETATIVDRAPPVKMGSPHTITVRRSGDVWVVGQDAADPRLGSTVVRFTRGGAGPTKPVLVRSDADQRNEVLNSRGLRPWEPKCNSAFVPFPVTRDPASDAGEAKAVFDAYAKELEAAVAKIDLGQAKPLPLQVAAVQGSFGGRPTAGVVLLRSEPIVSPQNMEAAVARVAAIASRAAGGGTGADGGLAVTCSVPTLDAVIAMLH